MNTSFNFFPFSFSFLFFLFSTEIFKSVSAFTDRFMENHGHHALNVHQDNEKQDIFRKITMPDAIIT